MTKCETDQRKPYLPFDIEVDYLTDWMAEKAVSELHETDKTRKEALIELRKIIGDDPRFILPMDDAYLLFYLRNRKFNVKKTVAQIHHLLTLKTSQGDLFDPDFDGFKEAIQSKLVGILPYRDIDGTPLVFVNFKNWNPDDGGMDSLLRMIGNIVIASIDFHKATQICGIQIIADIGGLSLRHCKYFTPKYMKLVAAGTTNVFPVRIKAVHLLNESTLFQYGWNIVKLFMSDKMKKRVNFHGTNLKSLHKCIDPAILPKEYGGTLAFDITNDLLKKVDERENRYYELWTTEYCPQKRRDSR